MTTNRAWLGLMGAALVFAACSSSMDSLLNTGGRGGSANGGSGGAAGTASAGRGGSGGAGGAGGARACEQATCLRPYTCITQCGGPIISNNCCPCEAPAFDNFQNVACGGAGGGGVGGGAAGAAGSASGGSGGAGNGGAGSSGSAGRGGSGGGAAGAAGSSGSGGRGGSSGAAGTASGGAGGSVDAGTDAFNCATATCARPYRCVNACGGPVISYNCCSCVAPAFDDFLGACGDGGTGAISYVGCRYIGGYDRIVVAKRDTSRDLCVNVVLIDGTTPAPAGLTLPPTFTLDSATVGTASACPTMARLPTVGGPVTGSVVSTSDGGSLPSTVDVDLHVTLPGNDEAIIARGVNVAAGCL